MKKILIDFEKDLKITKVKEDINLAMFNSTQFSFQDMKNFNTIMEAVKNVKLQINIH